MDTRYYLAFGVLVMWIVVRLFLMHRRAVRRRRWLEEQAAHEHDEADADADAPNDSA